MRPSRKWTPKGSCVTNSMRYSSGLYLTLFLDFYPEKRMAVATLHDRRDHQGDLSFKPKHYATAIKYKTRKDRRRVKKQAKRWASRMLMNDLELIADAALGTSD